MKEKLVTIFNHFGFKTQMKKLNEEMYELIEAIYEYEEQFVNGTNDEKEEELWEHIAEELADCNVLLSQIGVRYGISYEKLKKISEKKIDRTIERINNNFYSS